LQDMEARGRIGGEPVPAGGPMNDDDLSPEELAAIQEMMGMAEGGVVNMYKQQQDLYSDPNPAIGNSMGMASGGQVRGFNPGGLQPAAQQTQDQIYAAGQQAQQAGYVGAPLGFSIFPTQAQLDAGQTTPSYATAQQPAFEPVNLIHPETFVKVVATTQEMYDQYLEQGYVLDDGSIAPAGTQTAPDDGGSTPPPTGDSKPAYEDWLNSADFNSEAGIEKFIAGIEYDPSKSKLDMQTLGATIMGGPMAGLATAAGGALRGGGLQAISDLRAASLIAKAQGLDELAGKIDAQVADIIKDGPDILDFLDDFLATGKQKGNAWAKKNGFENIDAAIEAGVTPKPAAKPPAQPATTSGDDEPNWASATDASSAAQVAAANVSEGVDAGQAAEAAAAGVNAGVSAASAAEAAAAGATSIGSGVASTIEDTGRESQGIAGSSSGPMNKGGLMATPKKKAKRQYKKGGLANKK